MGGLLPASQPTHPVWSRHPRRQPPATSPPFLHHHLVPLLALAISTLISPRPAGSTSFDPSNVYGPATLAFYDTPVCGGRPIGYTLCSNIHASTTLTEVLTYAHEELPQLFQAFDHMVFLSCPAPDARGQRLPPARDAPFSGVGWPSLVRVIPDNATGAFAIHEYPLLPPLAEYVGPIPSELLFPLLNRSAQYFNLSLAPASAPLTFSPVAAFDVQSIKQIKTDFGGQYTPADFPGIGFQCLEIQANWATTISQGCHYYTGAHRPTAAESPQCARGFENLDAYDVDVANISCLDCTDLPLGYVPRDIPQEELLMLGLHNASIWRLPAGTLAPLKPYLLVLGLSQNFLGTLFTGEAIGLVNDGTFGEPFVNEYVYSESTMLPDTLSFNSFDDIGSVIIDLASNGYNPAAYGSISYGPQSDIFADLDRLGTICSGVLNLNQGCGCIMVLDNNPLGDITDWTLAGLAFKNNGNPPQLSLNNIGASSIASGVFTQIGGLTGGQLNLDNNRLTILDNGLIKGCLGSLSIANNTIAEIRPGWYLDFPLTIGFSMEGNPSSCEIVGNYGQPSRINCTCAPGYFGDGTYCVNKPCDTATLVSSLATDSLRRTTLKCPSSLYKSSAGSSPDEPVLVPVVPSGTECSLVCATGYSFSSTDFIASQTIACLGGIWGTPPTSPGNMPTCEACEDGYALNLQTGDCHIETAPSTTTAIGITIGVLFGVLAIVLIGVAVHLRRRRRLMRKAFHVFISYRVQTDAALARELYHRLTDLSLDEPDALTRPGSVGSASASTSASTTPSSKSAASTSSMPLSVFWDQMSLSYGEDWRKQFLQGLERTCVLVPLISAEALAQMRNPELGRVDNLLLEWETALAAKAAGRMLIFPVFVGDEATGAGQGPAFAPYDFDGAGAHQFPPTPSQSQLDAARLLQRVGIGAGRIPTIRDTLCALFAIQGANLSRYSGSRQAVLDQVTADIGEFVQNKAWRSGELDCLQLHRFWVGEALLRELKLVDESSSKGAKDSADAAALDSRPVSSPKRAVVRFRDRTATADSNDLTESLL